MQMKNRTGLVHRLLSDTRTQRASAELGFREIHLRVLSHEPAHTRRHDVVTVSRPYRVISSPLPVKLLF